MTRPEPERYFHGGEVVVVPGRVCHMLARGVGVEDWWFAHRAGMDPELSAVMVAIIAASRRWSARQTGSALTSTPEPQKDRYSTAEAAARLGLTDRGVRKAIAEGRLGAEVVGNRYRISRESLAHFRGRSAA